MKSIIGLIESLKDDVSGSSPEKLNKIVTLLSTIYDSLDYSVEGTLPANQGTVTLEDENIKEGINVSVYTSIYKVSPLSITVSDGRIVLTFNPQTVDMGIKVTFKKDVDWDKLINSTGIDTSDATALISDILSGKTAYVNGEKITGTMPSIPAISKILEPDEIYTIPKGYHDGTGVVTANNNTQLYTVTVDGKEICNDLHLILSQKTYCDIEKTTLPYGTPYGAVVYNDEIHVQCVKALSGTSVRTEHIKWNGSEWTDIGSVGYYCEYAAMVVYNNEIHILGDNSFNNTYHYKWNGSTWTSASTLPFPFSYGSAVVYNNEIHILGSHYGTHNKKHYKWDGSTWTEVSITPIDENPSHTRAIVYNNEIHLFGCGTSGDNKKHYKWDGSTWTSVSTLPYDFFGASVVVHKNKLYIVGGSERDNYSWNRLYVWTGNDWVEAIPYLPCISTYPAVALSYNGKLCTVGVGTDKKTVCSFGVKTIYTITE